jgi:hypothetical protein
VPLQELREETSIRSVQLLGEAPRWLAYDFPPEVRARLSSYWARYKGQAQRWFLFKFTGDNSGEPPCDGLQMVTDLRR